MSTNLQDVTGASSTPTPSVSDVTPPSSSGPDATPPSSSGPDVNPSDPSTETKPVESKEDLLSVVRSAAETYGKPETPESEPAKAEASTGVQPGQEPNADPNQDAKDPKDKRDPAEIPADELAKYSPNAQARIRDLVKANKDLRAQVEAATPAAQGYEQLTNYLSQNQLRQDDVNLLLHVGATLRRGDLKGFLDAVVPYVEAAQEALGVKLAPDLRQRVEEGVMDETSAREMTRLRAERAVMQANLRDQQEMVQQTQVQAHAAAVQTAIADWEQSVARTDPDYAVKQDTVRDFAKAIIAERGLPATPQQAVEYAQEALRRTNVAVSRFRPAPAPTRPSPSGVQAATAGHPEPRNLQEAMRLGLERARAG